MPTTTAKPNILFICTDQQRWDSLGCYGNPNALTPAIDALAAEGVCFDQCYVQSPVCAPSRASLVTGQYPGVHGLWANGVALRPGSGLVSRALARAGYDCGMIGKMHLAACFNGRTEERQPDDGYRVYQWAHDPSHASPENDYHRWLAEHHPDLLATARAGGQRIRHQPASFDTMPTGAHYSRWAGERAIEFLDQRPDPEQPFFLWVNFYDPHHPFVAPQEYLDRFDPQVLPDPIGFPGELDSKPEIQREASAESYAGFARGFADHTPAEIREIRAAYAAMIALIDDETGRILARLHELGLDDETLVIFTSDHGEMLGDHELLLKGPMLYEMAVRVPLILRWPGHLPAGVHRNELVQWIDLNPTFTDAAGIEPLPGAQGQSLLPQARGDANAPTRDWAICEYRNSGHPYDPPVMLTMLRHDRWKLIVEHGPPASSRQRTGELYDLAADPQELANLWDDPTHASTRIDLERFLMDVLVANQDRSQPREAHW